MGLTAAHRGTGITFRPPPGWRVEASGADLVLAIENAGAQSFSEVGFRANLVLSVVDNGNLTFAQWQRASDTALPVLLDSYELVDLRRMSVGGSAGGWRLARHLSVSGEVLVMQQWFTAWGHTGVTLTATSDIASYRLLVPHMRRAAASLTLPQRVTPC